MLTIYYTWLNIGVLFSRHTSLRIHYPSTIRQVTALPCLSLCRRWLAPERHLLWGTFYGQSGQSCRSDCRHEW